MRKHPHELVITTVRIRQDDMEKLAIIAKKQRRRRGVLIRDAVHDYVNNYTE